MSIDIRLANSRTSVPELYQTDDPGNIVTPGDIITADTGFMRGHGTYMDEDCLHASVAGSVERVNKLISVRPLKTRYNGEIGDVVIGRIIEVAQRKWRVETHSRMDSILMLSSVNLPGGELRRRSEEDEKMMRNYLKEGDLISLGQGTLVKVSPSLILRRKTHFHNLPVGASVILGNNGYIWITPTEHVEAGETGGYQTNLQPVSRSDREAIARLRNCILALADQQMLLFDTSILYTYEVSSKYNVKELLKPEVILEVVDLVQQRLELEGG
ncbi:exosome complex component RRP4-like isoform X2 [Physella acuta]|uniref:exosome complex component RRP4-like isoform X2 n=1 Tax=Physella acuta TaxID=109671 RepID=UPI0027DBF3D8|nr:exosome complex component RRP4-like isoform X2 [Physella acuta]